MDLAQAATQFGALAHTTRLQVFKALIQAGPGGRPAGELADLVSVSPSNLSAHLTVLNQADLITMRRDGRMRIYAVSIERTAELVSFLVEDCCQGHPEICQIAQADISASKLSSSCSA
ncbi:ArsR/SmtB family transcription factor [Woodsholea maritima]|uniref:ArsR/SmtB family transcription factor n=1 Tax=Woodsholea maritima TaxID=240237 RepID=UPI00036272CF|nr:metalloregulator ArsR/SmtB family transcription factor [Woodsholea maritima]